MSAYAFEENAPVFPRPRALPAQAVRGAGGEPAAIYVLDTAHVCGVVCGARGRRIGGGESWAVKGREASADLYLPG